MNKLLFVFAIVAIAALNFVNLNDLEVNSKSALDLNSMSIALAWGESATYKGPLCSNASGTKYCCKDSSGSCSAGAKCSSCS